LNVPYRDRIETTATFASDIAYAVSTGTYNKESVDVLDPIQEKQSKKKKDKKKTDKKKDNKDEYEIEFNEPSENKHLLGSSLELQLELKNENILNVPYRDRIETTATFASDIAYAVSTGTYNKESVDVLDPIQEKQSKKKKEKKKNRIEMSLGNDLKVEVQEHDLESLPKPKYDLDRDVDLTYGEVVLGNDSEGWETFDELQSTAKENLQSKKKKKRGKKVTKN